MHSKNVVKNFHSFKTLTKVFDFIEVVFSIYGMGISTAPDEDCRQLLVSDFVSILCGFQLDVSRMNDRLSVIRPGLG